MIERKQLNSSADFNVERLLNPALRAQTRGEDDVNNSDFLKIKSLFTGEQAKNKAKSK